MESETEKRVSNIGFLLSSVSRFTNGWFVGVLFLAISSAGHNELVVVV
jgi:hypothetical protein